MVPKPSPGVSGLGFLCGEGILGEAKVLDDAPPDKVLLNDAFGIFGGDVTVPGAFGIDNGDRPVDADAEALGLGAVAGAVGAGEAQLVEAVFEVVPRLGAVGDLGAQSGPRAEKDVAA